VLRHKKQTQKICRKAHNNQKQKTQPFNFFLSFFIIILDESQADQNQKSAFSYFCKAAGVFEHLLQRAVDRNNGDLSDLKQGVYEALVNFVSPFSFSFLSFFLFCHVD